MSQEEWPNAYRVVHLTNGVAAINSSQSAEVEITPYIPDQKKILTINKYGDLYSDLYKAGFKIIGVDFYEHAMQADGLYPPSWRPFHKIGEKGAKGEVWPVTICEEVWGNLSHAAFKKDDWYFQDLARRVQFQITSCLWELRSISETYARELNTFCRLQSYKDNQRFETQNSLFIYMAIHAFLSNIGTLRDFLAEFIAAFLIKEILPEKRITKMNSLIKELRKLDDKSNPIVIEILMAANHSGDNGWLAQMSAYRDLVVHYAPISHTEKRGFLTTKSMFVNGMEVPGIFLPLPVNPHELRKKRSTKGALHESVKEWIEESVSTDTPQDAKDALDYCHWVLFRICFLAAQLAGFSPYRPEIPTFSKKDLIGPIVTAHYKSGT
ncbi:MAG: hypothetical protein H6867_07150 [Rhodospirillales bacterium]|nr:hypothetical protein [Rhodospirillales bacterium]MCB9995327.1 hypothetical protein [Rhodospirillales bacterium]